MTTSSNIGSVGCFALILNELKKMEQEGIAIEPFVAGKYMIGELAPIEAAPRHLQAVEDDEDDGVGSTILTMPEGEANTGTPA